MTLRTCPPNFLGNGIVVECVDDLGEQEEEMLQGNNQTRQAGAPSGLGSKKKS